jgi:hypothetical protein
MTEHLRLDQVVQYARGGLEPAERERVEQHLAACDSCADEIGDVVRLSRREPSRTAWRWYGPLAAAAAVLLVVWTGRLQLSRDASAWRDQPITAADAPRPLGPAVTGSGGMELRWSPTAGADRYRVVLYDSAGTTIYEGETAETALTLPDSVPLVAGALYLWKVGAETSWDRWTSSDLVRLRPPALTPR